MVRANANAAYCKSRRYKRSAQQVSKIGELYIFLPIFYDILMARNVILCQMNWIGAMKEDDAVKESFISPENHSKYLKGHLAGNPDYDMELKW